MSDVVWVMMLMRTLGTLGMSRWVVRECGGRLAVCCARVCCMHECAYAAGQSAAGCVILEVFVRDVVCCVLSLCSNAGHAAAGGCMRRAAVCGGRCRVAIEHEQLEHDAIVRSLCSTMLVS